MAETKLTGNLSAPACLSAKLSAPANLAGRLSTVGIPTYDSLTITNLSVSYDNNGNVTLIDGGDS